MNADKLNVVLKKLQAKKAIKIIQGPSLPLVEISVSFWERLEKELSRCIGPIAPLVLDDKIEEFNKSRDNFPFDMMYSLIEKLATEIKASESKQQFQKIMIGLIKQY